MNSGTMIIPSTLSISSSGSGGVGWGTGQKKTISGGAITVSGSGIYILTPESGNSDELTTINGGSDGDSIRIYIDSDSYDITVKHNAGNIYIGYDFPLDHSYSMVELVKRGTVWTGGGLNENS